MSLAFDEYGRPFIIIRVCTAEEVWVWKQERPTDLAHQILSLQEQGAKSRVKGIEAVKASIHAAKSVSRILRSSLGPKGMDKMLQSPDGDVTISAYSTLF